MICQKNSIWYNVLYTPYKPRGPRIYQETARWLTYAMEDLLEPWVHYVPLAEDFSDVEEKMRRVLDHDHHAEQIAIRGTLWMQDLIERPEAEKENTQVEDEILRRNYQKHFRLQEDLELSSKKVRETLLYFCS